MLWSTLPSFVAGNSHVSVLVTPPSKSEGFTVTPLVVVVPPIVSETIAS